MNKTMRKTIYGIVLVKYLKASKSDKTKMLDGVMEVVGIDRKSLIRGLRNAQLKEPWTKFNGGRVTYYTPDSIAALKEVWLAANQCCGELLHSIIPEYVNIFQRDKMWKHGNEATKKLLKMSVATVKRNTSGWKCLGRKGISTTTPSSIKSRIPVFDGDWKDVPVGTGQVDTVAHCGSTMAGDFIFSCGYVDVPLGWIEYRVQWNKGAIATQNSLNSIKNDLPFKLTMLHPDCGSEFLNNFVINWCEQENINVTRSRSYHKNDNGYIEQRNGHIIRRHFGYVRYDNQDILNHFNELAKLICSYHNHFVPQRLCIGTKENTAGRTRKIYERNACTAYQRLLSKNVLTEHKRQELVILHDSLNPKTMLDKITKMKYTLISKNREVSEKKVI
jgi:hypothetical protein